MYSEYSSVFSRFSGMILDYESIRCFRLQFLVSLLEIPCGTKFLRVLIFAIFPAIRKSKFPQIKITANIFPAKISSRVNQYSLTLGTEKRATCLATLLENELYSDVVRFTTHIKPVLQQIRLLTGLNVRGKTRNIAIQLVTAMLNTNLRNRVCSITTCLFRLETKRHTMKYWFHTGYAHRSIV